MKSTAKLRVALVALSFVLLVAVMAVGQGLGSGGHEEPEHPDSNHSVSSYTDEVRRKGYVSLEKGSIVDGKKLRNATPLLAISELEQNTTFRMLKPKWLPPESKLIGGFPGGPYASEPWEIVSILYKTPQGEFRIGEAKPYKANQRVRYPKELLNGRTGTSRSIEMPGREKETGRRWNSIGWRDNQIDFLIQGELPLKVLRKIAESIKA